VKYLHVADDQGSRRKIDAKGIEGSKMKNSFFESIPEKYSTIASGATPIGSAGRAPDDVFL
jgi:hypothetical protein